MWLKIQDYMSVNQAVIINAYEEIETPTCGGEAFSALPNVVVYEGELYHRMTRGFMGRLVREKDSEYRLLVSFQKVSGELIFLLTSNV